MKTKTFLSTVLLCSAMAVQGQWSYTNLSEPKCQMGATSLGSKAYFGGGAIEGAYQTLVEIYDVENQTWSYGNLSFARQFPAGVSCGSKVFFAGGARFPYVYNYVDIYDTLTQQWSVAALSQPRFSIAAVSFGNKVLFAGGLDIASGIAKNRVDIYDIQTGTWSTASLSMARGAMSAGVVGDRAFFAGGFNLQSFTDRVDIYNFTTNTWSTAALSQARAFTAAAVVGNKILFAGGMTNPNDSTSSTTLVDIYDAETNIWSIAHLSQARAMFDPAATAGNKAFFVGGGNFNTAGGAWTSSLKIIDIYDGATGEWSVDYLTHDVINHSVTAVGNYLLSAGGYSITNDSLYATVEIYHVSPPSNIIHVPGDYPTIQAGINAATPGDTVLVADGLYYENISLMGKKPLVVASNFIMTGDTNHVANTIINGSQPANTDFGSVVLFNSGEDTTTVVCGFTITGGTGSIEAGGIRGGGGVFMDYSGGKLLNNFIEYNMAKGPNWSLGGGICAGGPVSPLPWVILRGNRIRYNEAKCTGDETAAGGGIACYYNLIMEDNEISYNQATGHLGANGGGADIAGGFGPIELNVRNNTITHNAAITDLGTSAYATLGGGLSMYINISGTIANNNISNNSLESPGFYWSWGPGVFIQDIGSDNFLFENNIIKANTTTTASCRGGGLSLLRSGGTYQNNVIQNNLNPSSYGGGVSMANSIGVGATAIFKNNTITENASTFGGGIYLQSSHAVVINSIIWGNTATNGPSIYETGSNLQVRYSDVEGATIWPGEGNKSIAPQFLPDGYHLSGQSLLVNTGTAGIVVNGVIYTCPPYDIDGDARPFQNTAPDIGADEYTPQIVAGDANCDGGVNVLDVVSMVNYVVGLNPQPFCFENADIDGNGQINVLDVVGTLNIILGSTKSGCQQASGTPGFIYLTEGNIELQSAGNIAGLQFEISGLKDGQLTLLLPGYEFAGAMRDNKFVGIVYSLNNTPLPAGRIRLFGISGEAGELHWGDIVAGNCRAEAVKVFTKEPDQLPANADELFSVYPNPSGQSINIEYQLDADSPVTLTLFNQLGQTIEVLCNEHQTAGHHLIIWNASGAPSGIYLLQLKTGKQVITKKIIKQ